MLRYVFWVIVSRNEGHESHTEGHEIFNMTVIVFWVIVFLVCFYSPHAYMNEGHESHTEKFIIELFGPLFLITMQILCI